METRHLIDAIVQQTTLLIAQLSTAAGIRAPLARIADQVFLELSRELEAQGVTRKVAADMFGLALRSYQKKIQRLSESATQREQTLWEVVLEYLRKRGGTTRRALLKAFEKENPQDLAAVIKDLLSSGVIAATGKGASAYYQVSSAEAVAAVAEQAELDVITHLVWLAIYDHQPIAKDALVARLPHAPEVTQRAIAALIEDARVRCDDGVTLRCTQLQIPVGAEQGWEAAVLDHFRAMANAIGAKLRTIGTRSSHADRVGGSTLSFSVHANHPFEQEVYGLLARVRADANALWNRVSEYNREHGIASEGMQGRVDSRIAVDGTHVYWMYAGPSDSDTELVRTSKAPYSTEVLWRNPPLRADTNLVVRGGFLYTSTISGQVVRIRLPPGAM